MEEMGYALENIKEGDRLEQQSQSGLYDPAVELADLCIQDGQKVLDAGCGSGIVARQLAGKHPNTHIVGIDLSQERISYARERAAQLTNLEFRVGSLLEAVPGQYDRIVCRYVLEHFSPDQQLVAVKNLANSLLPGGQLHLVDIDGYMQNVHPRTPLMDECLKTFQASGAVDFFAGRKLSSHLVDANLMNVTWQIQPLVLNTTETLNEEMKQIQERFAHTLKAMAHILGSETKAATFQREYIETIQRPGACLFYNKFIAKGDKPPVRLTVVEK